VEKRRGQGVFGQMAISFLPLDSEQRGGWRRPGRPAGGDCRRPRARRGSKDGAKRRGRQGGSIPLPVLGCDGVQGRLGGGGQREVAPAMAAALGSSRGRGRWLRRCEAKRGTSLVRL
jgi:hypothetical protein